jgi:hypothetical protein
MITGPLTIVAAGHDERQGDLLPTVGQPARLSRVARVADVAS